MAFRQETDQVEVFHHFDENEQAAMQALVDALERSNPGIEIDEQLATGVDHSLQVKTDILNHNPSHIWDVPAGELQPYMDTDVLLDVTDAMEETGFAATIDRMGKEAVTKDGRFYGVPVDIYRINNCFVNERVAEDIGVDLSRIDGPVAFVETMEQLNAERSVTPFPLDLDAWTDPGAVMQLWTTLLLGVLGPREFRSFVDGDATRYRSEVEQSLELLRRLDAMETDESSSGGITDDNVLCFHDGDWAAGPLRDDPEFEFGRDWDLLPFPGTENASLMGLNTLVGSNQTRNDDAIEALLRFCASREGQRTFNLEKMSIPPRMDMSMEAFHPYIQRQAQYHERASSYVPAITHGAGLTPEQNIELLNAVPSLLSNWDLGQAVTDICAALDD